MPSLDLLELRRSSRGAGLSCHWTLASGQAVSLQSRAPGVLRVMRGRVWITLDGPHPVLGRESGDHFLHGGESLALRAGTRLVMESWCDAADSPASFVWLPAAQGVKVPRSRWQLEASLVWRAGFAALSAASLATQQVLSGVGRLMPR